ncbi:15373_t:CDS:2, partial [Gigaspora margarita]
ASGLTCIKQCLADNLEPVCFEASSNTAGLWRYTEVDEENKDPHSSIYKSVVINTSHHRYPRLPKYKGMNKFKGIQIHSHFYREPTNFKDKRVVIVGCGNSGMDISVELSGNTSQAYICTRQGTLPLIVPRLVNGKPIDHKFSRFYVTWVPQFIQDHIIKIISKTTIGLPPPGLEPKNKPSNCHPTIKTDFYERLSTGTLIVKPDISQLNEDGSIEFVDGTKIEKIDAIIYSTGYQIKYPFLDKDIRMFPPKYPNIAFIGLVQLIGAIFPLSEMQARYVTSLIKGYIPQHPSISEMHKEIRKHQKLLQKRYYNAARYTIQGDYIPEIDSLAKDLGYYPYPFQIIKNYGFSLYLKVLFGIPNSFQYRLLGQQSWNGAADAIRVYNDCEQSKIK